MNKRQIILTVGFSVFMSSAALSTALAASPPKKSADFNGNYTTLTQDQKADPQVATCIATGYDLVKKNKKFDRLGFTQDVIDKAKVKNTKASSQELIVQGQARDRKSGAWQDIALHCTLEKNVVKSIAIDK